MPVRAMIPADHGDVLAMMRALWPDEESHDYADETVLVWPRPDGGLGGFVCFSLRRYAEGGTSSPVPYVEGWYVAPDLRRAGVGRALIAAVEDWCRAHGYTELGSDVELDNDISLQAHAALGFHPVTRLQHFLKRLG